MAKESKEYKKDISKANTDNCSAREIKKLEEATNKGLRGATARAEAFKGKSGVSKSPWAK